MDRGKFIRQFSLVSSSSSRMGGHGVKRVDSGIFVLANYESYLVRVHENVQHPSQNLLIPLDYIITYIKAKL